MDIACRKSDLIAIRMLEKAARERNLMSSTWREKLQESNVIFLLVKNWIDLDTVLKFVGEMYADADFKILRFFLIHKNQTFL